MDNQHLETFYISTLKTLGKCTLTELADTIKKWHPVYASRLQNNDGTSQIEDIIESVIIDKRHPNAFFDISTVPMTIHYKES